MRSLITENAEHNTFIIYGGQRAITVSAGTTAEKTLWLAELAKASNEIKSKPHVQLSLGTLKNCSKYQDVLSIVDSKTKFLTYEFIQKVRQKRDLKHAAHRHRINRQLERQVPPCEAIMPFMCVGIVAQRLA